MHPRLALDLALGLVETLLLNARPGRRSPLLYVKAMLVSHLPLVSERFDTAKDILLECIDLANRRSKLI